MANFKDLTAEMEKLKNQITNVLTMANYSEDDDLSALEDYKQIKTADERQQLEEYRNILYKLEEVQSILAYYKRPILEESQVHKNETGRFETEKGHYYTSGSGIEFLRTEEVYNEETNAWEEAEIWTTSRIESKDGEYYVVGYPKIKLPGLKVRVRR